MINVGLQRVFTFRKRSNCYALNPTYELIHRSNKIDSLVFHLVYISAVL